jgi:putative thioredoxin
MSKSAVLEVDEASFDAEVIERSHEVPVVVDFWAAWCGPCRMLGPVLEREAEARGDQVVLAKLDVDANQRLAAEYQVRGIPAVKAFRNGAVVDEFTGALPPPAVAAFLDGLLGPSEAERLVDGLRERGELPAVVAAFDAGAHERALELLLAEAEDADADGRERVRELMVALFGHLGVEHPLTLRYRRRLAALLF